MAEEPAQAAEATPPALVADQEMQLAGGPGGGGGGGGEAGGDGTCTVWAP